MSSTPEGPLSILNLIVHFLSYQLSSIVFSFVTRSFPAWFCRLTCFSFAILNHCPTKCLFSPIRWSKNLNQDHKAQNPEESLIKFTCSFPELLWLIGPERKKPTHFVFLLLKLFIIVRNITLALFLIFTLNWYTLK